ncbi:hypothetical protein JKP88DRAFT_217432, partial [Tribonema minus]
MLGALPFVATARLLSWEGARARFAAPPQLGPYIARAGGGVIMYLLSTCPPPCPAAPPPPPWHAQTLMRPAARTCPSGGSRTMHALYAEVSSGAARSDVGDHTSLTPLSQYLSPPPP